MNVSWLINLIVNLTIIGLILWLLWWLIGYASLPEPINKVARIVVAVVGVLYLISLLAGMAPMVKIH